MKIFYTVDVFSRVIPVCDWNESIDAEDDWHIGEIAGNAYESHGIPLYKDVDGAVTLRTPAEIQSDIDALPIPEPTEAELLRADIDYLLMLAEEE